MITKEEMIGCQSWYDLADYHFTGQDDLPEGVIHCDMAAIPECFKTMEHYPDRKYVVISSRCDFGLHYQHEHPPWRDYGKMANCCIGPQESRNGYIEVLLPPPINKNRCDPNHKYSIKCYRLTEATFSHIPGNVVKWFAVNNTVLDDSRVVSIPFGVNNVDGSMYTIDKIAARQHAMFSNRPKELYVNFTFYNEVRFRLYNLYRHDSFATCEQNQEYDKFLDQLEIHNCILCPPGNGWDCYRTLEALYMGCIPVVEDNAAMRVYNYMRMPCVFVTSLEVLSKEVMQSIRKSWLSQRDKWDLSKATLSYWKGLINEARGLL